MSRRATRQILAIGSLLGFFLLTAAYVWMVRTGIDTSGLELPFGAWSALVGSATTFYFTGEQGDTQP